MHVLNLQGIAFVAYHDLRAAIRCHHTLGRELASMGLSIDQRPVIAHYSIMLNAANTPRDGILLVSPMMTSLSTPLSSADAPLCPCVVRTASLGARLPVGVGDGVGRAGRVLELRPAQERAPPHAGLGRRSSHLPRRVLRPPGRLQADGALIHNPELASDWKISGCVAVVCGTRTPSWPSTS